jgi:hypothetical protein
MTVFPPVVKATLPAERAGVFFSRCAMRGFAAFPRAAFFIPGDVQKFFARCSIAEFVSMPRIFFGRGPSTQSNTTNKMSGVQ